MNESCNNSQQSSPPWVAHLSSAYAALLLLLGLLLNGLALWVLCCRLPRWTETRVYMVNLAAADLCLLCALPFMLLNLRYRESDTLFCQLSQGIYLVNRYMSVSLIMAIAVDRYLAVRHPLRARGLRSPSRAAAVCALLWVLVGSSLAARWTLSVQEGGFCFSTNTRHHIDSVVFSLLGFYLPLIVLVFCSLQVVAGLAQRPLADSAQAEATRKAARMVWANLAVFVVCFLPLHVVLTVYYAIGPHSCAWRQVFMYSLYFTSRLSDANCCLDAICYYYMAKEFQEARSLALGAKAHRSQESVGVVLT
ncbi:G-protein coupled receptor 35-like [Elephas maximus indicus]|uniref:G-protein coupled receptor 35-like n=1 Tax=Elephas maximus indicus TaxID=99487 RepID=UPI002116E0E0|nr:G-protein coupled receptor 35-like [Elephas maximus indicus]XP_049744577.1 G-protein coupled receptor 35-like [Elephas maximus indicus]XP_049744578.1 G-protein coupled receptor 35-like [Elephas maximus indicus]XP_049744579.1 G-protein coupled receptor 35-like [Elephas maximus indicus]